MEGQSVFLTLPSLKSLQLMFKTYELYDIAIGFLFSFFVYIDKATQLSSALFWYK